MGRRSSSSTGSRPPGVCGTRSLTALAGVPLNLLGEPFEASLQQAPLAGVGSLCLQHAGLGTVSGGLYGMADAVGAPQQVPFNVVDEVVYLLDTEAEPWSVQVEVRVAGTLDEERLRAALSEALDRHPMARARKAPGGRRREHQYCWEITAQVDLDPLRILDCPDDQALNTARTELQSRPVSLAESPPLRMWLARNPNGDVLMVSAHHAAMDGFGALRFVRSVARAYAQEPDPVPDVDPLEARSLRMLVGTDDTPTTLRRLAMVAEKARDALSPPARIAPDGGADRPGYGLHQLRLSATQTQHLVTKELPGTVNDVLVAALHLSIAGWNEEHGVATRRIGVMVPVNMRPSDWQQEVVGNVLLPVRVTTGPGDRTSPMAALECVVGQSKRIKETGTGGALIEVLGRSTSFPLGIKEASSPLLKLLGNRLADSALLSNLANLDDPPSFGDAGETSEVWFSAPVRMPLGLSIGIVTVAGRLHAAFRYRHPLFGADAVARFAERYVEAVERFLAL